jgi:uncharacterized membrane protein
MLIYVARKQPRMQLFFKMMMIVTIMIVVVVIRMIVLLGSKSEYIKGCQHLDVIFGTVLFESSLG